MTGVPAVRRRLEGMDPVVLAALVVLPEWTDRLVVELGVVPKDELPALLDRLDDDGLIDRRRSLLPDGSRGITFWARAETRRDAAAHLGASSPTLLLRQARTLAGTLRVRADLDALGLRPWTEVVVRYLDDPTGRALFGEVERLMAAGGMAAAIRLVAAARILGEVVGAPLSDAARRAQWRLDRALRAERDARDLVHYLHREDIERRLSDLLDARDGSWALHLRGAAGVGKTMVVRYLASARFAAAHDHGDGFPVARVDFDHLDPRYPHQRPGELLLALAGELLGFSESRAAAQAYDRLLDTARSAHEELARTEPRAARADRLRTMMTREFGKFLSELAAPQVLILDTCEELSKLYAPGAPAPAIDRTFEILEQVHEQCPTMRVLFAGRRWLVPPPEEHRRAAEPALSPRPYLRDIEVDQFDLQEAQRYLTLRAQPAAAFSPALRTAVLAAVAKQTGGGRYSPFDLNAYGEWALADPDLDPAVLLPATGDPYVEQRILGRLNHQPTLLALPAAVEFGRFDLRLIAPALERIGVDPVEAFTGLAAQEWVETIDLDPSGRPFLIEIDRHLQSRLRRALRRDTDREALGRDAEHLIDRLPLDDIPTATVESAIRLLPVSAAAALWQRIDARVLHDRAWAWAAQVTVRVAAHLVDQPQSVLAAVLATQASAWIHLDRGHDLAALWTQVGLAVDQYPDPAVRHILRRRSSLGGLAAGEKSDHFEATEQPFDAVIAAAERRIEDGRGLGPLLEAALAEAPDGPLAPVASMLLLVRDIREQERSRESLTGIAERGARLALQAADNVWDGITFADWAPPPGLVHRLRLVALVAMGPSSRPPSFWADWWEAAVSDIADIDAERLLSAMLLADFACDRKPLCADAYQLAKYVPERMARWWIQREIPPIVASIAEYAEAPDEVDRALKALQRFRRQAIDTGTDPDAIDDCQYAMLRLARRERRTDLFSSVDRLAELGSPMVRAEAWLVLTLVHNRTPATVEAAGSLYGYVRCLTREYNETIRKVTDEAGISRTGVFATAYEASPTVSRQNRLDEVVAAIDRFRVDRLADHVRAVVARGGIAPGDLVPPVPARLLGRAMLDAGEALALRYPGRVTDLLDRAAELLRPASPIHAAQASTLALLAQGRSHQPLAARALLAHQLADNASTRWFDGPWKERLAVAHGERPAAEATAESPELRGQLAERQAWLRVVDLANKRVRALRTSTNVAVSALSVGSGLAMLALPVFLSAVPDPISFIGSLLFILGVTNLATEPQAIFPAYWFVRGFTASRTFSLRPGIDGHGASVVRQLSPPGVRRVGGLSRIVEILLELTDDLGTVDSSKLDVVPAGLTSALRSRIDRPSLLSLAFESTDPEFRGLDWERRLSAGADRSRLPDLLWYRRIEKPAAAPSSVGEPHWTYLGPSHLYPIATRSSTPVMRTVFAVGAVAETAAGARFRARSWDTDMGPGHETVGADVLGTIAEAGLVVLMAEPVDGPPEPLGDQRPLFIAYAEDLVAAGADAVLVIPPLPDKAVSAVMREIGTWIDAQRKVPKQLAVLRELRTVRRMVAEAEQDQPFDLEKLATPDVLLFLRSPV